MAKVRLETTSDTRAAKRLNQEFERGTDELEKLAKASRGVTGQKRKWEEMADPVKKIDREFANLALSVKKFGLSEEDAAKAAEKLQRRLDRINGTGKSAFGMPAIGNILAYAKSIASISAAIAGVTRALEENRKEREAGVEGSRSAVRGEASLAQLAVTMGSTEAERKAAQKRLLAESRAAFASGAFTSRDEAGTGTFGLNSAGLGDADRQFAYRLRRSGAVENIGDAGTAYSSMVKAMGLDEVGSFDDFMDKALQASSLAPAQANEIPLAAAKAAGSARSMKMSDEFIIAGTALLAGVKGSAAEGGTALSAFMRQAEKAAAKDESLQGLSGVDLVKAFAAMPEEKTGFGGVFGDNAEAIAAYRDLRNNIGTLERETGNIGRAQSENLAQQAIAVAESDPNTRAAVYARQKKNQMELSTLDQSTSELLFESAWSEGRRSLREQRPGFLTELQLGIEGTQLGIETLGGLIEARGWKDSAVSELRQEGRIQDAGLEQAIRENTRALTTGGGRQE